jgi:diguanylate cyclase (GGDEF)-like protein
MDRRFSLIFLIVSGVFFIFIVGLTGFRIEQSRRHNAEQARERVPSLVAKARSLGNSTGGYGNPEFSRNMRTVFDAEPRLLLLSLHSADEGILYLVARNKSYLKVPEVVTADWRGTPVYGISGGYDLLVTEIVPGAAQGLTLDAVFVVMGREDLYPVVRDDLYLFLAFLLVCGVIILILMSIQMEDPGRHPRAAAAAPVAPVVPHVPEEPKVSEQRPQPAPVPASAEHRPQPAPVPASTEHRPHGLTSPRTGLVWAEYLEPRLQAELERAASSDQDISVARIRIEEPRDEQQLPVVTVEIARQLSQSFRLHDLIFETGDDAFTLLLPDTDVDAAVRVLEEFRKKSASAVVEGMNLILSIGVSARGGRLIGEKVLLEEADIAVAKAAREGGNQVIGFRADATRFRSSLVESTT